MDIAEIRKKAKAQGRPDEPAAVAAQEMPPAAPETPAPVPEPVAEETAVVATAQRPEPALAHNDALDRLFASDSLALATDASYAELLDSQADAGHGDLSQYLAFHLDDEEYALDIRQISEIIKVREFTDIPRAPDYVLGIISLRGVVVPVFDLRRRLNLGAAQTTAASRIVVCQLDDVTVGLLVDSINQVVNLADADIEPPPGVLSGLDREMVHGIGRTQGRMIILLQLRSVLDIELD